MLNIDPAEGPLCIIKSDVDVGDESSVFVKTAVGMTVRTYGAMVEQGGAGSGSLCTRAVSQTVSSGSCVLAMVFGKASGLQSFGVDDMFIVVGKNAGVIW